MFMSSSCNRANACWYIASNCSTSPESRLRTAYLRCKRGSMNLELTCRHTQKQRVALHFCCLPYLFSTCLHGQVALAEVVPPSPVPSPHVFEANGCWLSGFLQGFESYRCHHVPSLLLAPGVAVLISDRTILL